MTADTEKKKIHSALAWIFTFQSIFERKIITDFFHKYIPVYEKAYMQIL